MLFINEHRHVDGDIDDIISSDKISIAQDVCLFNGIVGIGHHIAQCIVSVVVCLAPVRSKADLLVAKCLAIVVSNLRLSINSCCLEI